MCLRSRVRLVAHFCGAWVGCGCDVMLVIDALWFVWLTLVAWFVDLVCLVGVEFVVVVFGCGVLLFMCLLVAWMLSD